MNFSSRSFWIELYSTRDVIQQLIAQQLILRYRRTAMGYLWTLINPLLMMTVMALVFSAIFKADLKTFTIFLFTGMVPWNFFNSVVTQSALSFISNEGLIKKIYLPKLIFPLSLTIALFIDNILSFVVLFVLILLLGVPLSGAIFFIPIAYALLFILAFGVSLIVSTASVFFRDLQYILGIVMQGLFFLTPILYKPEALAGKVTWLVALNPLVPFIELFRAPLYMAEMPSMDAIVRSFLIAAAVFALGLLVFRRRQKDIVFRL